MSQRVPYKIVKYTITYKALDGRVLLVVRDYEYKTKKLGMTEELNPICIEAHIRGLRENGGQNGLPGGYDEGFVGIIEMESKLYLIKRTLKFDTPMRVIRE